MRNYEIQPQFKNFVVKDKCKKCPKTFALECMYFTKRASKLLAGSVFRKLVSSVIPA